MDTKECWNAVRTTFQAMDMPAPSQENWEAAWDAATFAGNRYDREADERLAWNKAGREGYYTKQAKVGTLLRLAVACRAAARAVKYAAQAEASIASAAKHADTAAQARRDAVEWESVAPILVPDRLRCAELYESAEAEARQAAKEYSLKSIKAAEAAIEAARGTNNV